MFRKRARKCVIAAVSICMAVLLLPVIPAFAYTDTVQKSQSLYQSGSFTLKLSDGFGGTKAYKITCAWHSTANTYNGVQNNQKRVDLSMDGGTGSGKVTAALGAEYANTQRNTGMAASGSSAYYIYLVIPVSVTVPAGCNYSSYSVDKPNIFATLSTNNSSTLTTAGLINAGGTTVTAYLCVNVALPTLKTTSIDGDGKAHMVSGCSYTINFRPNRTTVKIHANGGQIETDTSAATRYRLGSDGLAERSTDSGASWEDIAEVVPANVSYYDLSNVETLGISKKGYHADSADAYNTNAAGTGLDFNQNNTAANDANPVTTTRLNGGSQTTGDRTVTLHTKWKANTYTVSYNANGGSGTTETSSHMYDTAKVLTANGFSRTGYTFAGWNTRANGTGTSFSDKQSVTNLSSVNGDTVMLYAQWTEKTATLSYAAAGTGITVPPSVTMKYTSAVNTSSISDLSGYTWKGWATSLESALQGNAQYAFGTQYKAANVIPSDAKLYATLAGTLSFNANGHGTSPASIEMHYKGVVYTPAAPDASGYTFTGWNTKPDGTGTAYAAGAVYKGDQVGYVQMKNMTLYAQWIPAAETADFTLPESLIMYRKGNGSQTLTIGNYAISNSSNADCRIDSIRISGVNGWTIVPESTDFSSLGKNVQKISVVAAGTADLAAGPYTSAGDLNKGTTKTISLTGKCGKFTYECYEKAANLITTISIK